MRWAVICFTVAAAWAQTAAPVTVVVPLPVDAGASGVRVAQPLPLFGGNVLPFYRNRPLPNSGNYTGFYPGYFGNGFLNGLWVQTALRSGQGIAPGPSYANPGPVPAAASGPAPLEAPAVPSTAEWAEMRTSFSAASASVSSARTALEELRARLAALGQSPRASLIASVASAEAALKQAQAHMAEGTIESARTETQRAAYIARQVLKEFGR